MADDTFKLQENWKDGSIIDISHAMYDLTLSIAAGNAFLVPKWIPNQGKSVRR